MRMDGPFLLLHRTVRLPMIRGTVTAHVPVQVDPVKLKLKQPLKDTDQDTVAVLLTAGHLDGAPGLQVPVGIDGLFSATTGLEVVPGLLVTVVTVVRVGAALLFPGIVPGLLVPDQDLMAGINVVVVPIPDLDLPGLIVDGVVAVPGVHEADLHGVPAMVPGLVETTDTDTGLLCVRHLHK